MPKGKEPRRRVVPAARDGQGPPAFPSQPLHITSFRETLSFLDLASAHASVWIHTAQLWAESPPELNRSLQTELQDISVLA